MNASKEILSVWRTFDDFPMETLTKAWFFHQPGERKQRSVSLMKEHKQQYGITGNCFDLAIWLADEFAQRGITAYPVGDAIHTSDAHVAIIAEDERANRFLCDLGDQWIQPVLIEQGHEEFTTEKLAGFFPAAQIQVMPRDEEVEILYHRPNGKTSRQTYQTRAIGWDEFQEAAERSQQNIYPKPLLEKRLLLGNEVTHWEFFDWRSFLSTNDGLHKDSPLSTVEEWVERIWEKTGYDQSFLRESLTIYKEKKFKKHDQ
ncbi:MAG TPA: hypothetical protein VK947_01880 [Planococcus sp. (in: firmicutes)]|nr:hypothetical protein [Planococcus sp. (in: firmicutes)]